MLSVCAMDGTSPIYLPPPPNVSVGKGSPSSMLLAAQLVGSQLSDIISSRIYITVDLPTEVCHSVSIEHKTANVEDGACADISALRFWGDRQQLTFFLY